MSRRCWLEKAAAATPDLVQQYGERHERMGTKTRNVGYGSMLAAGGASFIPVARRSPIARRSLRTVAALAGLTGYAGEGGIRTGRGYQRAAAVASGKKKPPTDAELFHMSPTAYHEAMSAMGRLEKVAGVDKEAVSPQWIYRTIEKAKHVPVSKLDESRINFMILRRAAARTRRVAASPTFYDTERMARRERQLEASEAHRAALSNLLRAARGGSDPLLRAESIRGVEHARPAINPISAEALREFRVAIGRGSS